MDLGLVWLEKRANSFRIGIALRYAIRINLGYLFLIIGSVQELIDKNSRINKIDAMTYLYRMEPT